MPTHVIAAFADPPGPAAAQHVYEAASPLATDGPSGAFSTANRGAWIVSARVSSQSGPAAGSNMDRKPSIPMDPPTHSPDGVDLTLIRWTLSLTPLQRLEVLQSAADSLVRLRDAAGR